MVRQRNSATVAGGGANVCWVVHPHDGEDYGGGAKIEAGVSASDWPARGHELVRHAQRTHGEGYLALLTAEGVQVGDLVYVPPMPEGQAVELPWALYLDGGHQTRPLRSYRTVEDAVLAAVRGPSGRYMVACEDGVRVTLTVQKVTRKPAAARAANRAIVWDPDRKVEVA